MNRKPITTYGISLRPRHITSPSELIYVNPDSGRWMSLNMSVYYIGYYELTIPPFKSSGRYTSTSYVRPSGEPYHDFVM